MADGLSVAGRNLWDMAQTSCRQPEVNQHEKVFGESFSKKLQSPSPF
ncbi:hypothetical protein [Acetobacter sp. UBA5411]|nr:hypothetical protein [Acetobacter sp. UBA5411]